MSVLVSLGDGRHRRLATSSPGMVFGAAPPTGKQHANAVSARWPGARRSLRTWRNGKSLAAVTLRFWAGQRVR